MAQFYCAGKQDPKDLLTHLAKVISKSRGRWCHGQILHCFGGVLICIYNWQPYLPVRSSFCMLTCESQLLPAVCEVFAGTGSFTMASRLTETLRMFLLGDKGGGMQTFPSSSAKNTLREWMNPPLPFSAGSWVWKCWHTEWRTAPETQGIPLRRRRAAGVGWGWGGALECTQRSQSLIYWLNSVNPVWLSLFHRAAPPLPAPPIHFPVCWVL